LARAKIATSTAVQPNPGCPPDRRKAAERGKMDGFGAVLLNRKNHQKNKYTQCPSGAYLMSISKYG
jgi:hypothetical protein